MSAYEALQIAVLVGNFALFWWYVAFYKRF